MVLVVEVQFVLLSVSVAVELVELVVVEVGRDETGWSLVVGTCWYCVGGGGGDSLLFFFCSVLWC